MRTVMSFQSKKALDFLLDRGLVVSFRKRRRKTIGKVWINDGRGKSKITNAVVHEIGYYKSQELPNVSYSGFLSLDEWLEEIKVLNGNILPREGWLYLIVLEN